MKNYIKPEAEVYKLESCLRFVKVDRFLKVMQRFMTIFSLMRKMVTDILVASIFGMTKTLKME